MPPASPDPNDLGTAVAATLTARAPGPVEGEPTNPGATPPPAEDADVLPRTLYYIAPDGAGITQVFRLERDGVTQTQLTTESGSVTDYDVSPVDGNIAFVANNQLLYANADGSESWWRAETWIQTTRSSAPSAIPYLLWMG